MYVAYNRTTYGGFLLTSPHLYAFNAQDSP